MLSFGYLGDLMSCGKLSRLESKAMKSTIKYRHMYLHHVSSMDCDRLRGRCSHLFEGHDGGNGQASVGHATHQVVVPVRTSCPH